MREGVPRAALLLALLLAGGCGDSPPGPPPGARAEFDLALEQRRVDLAGEAIRAHAGQQVEIRWTSDEEAVLHLHGYDVEIEVRPGEPARMAFAADRAGRFPIEVHRFGHEAEHAGGETVLLYLEVLPR